MCIRDRGILGMRPDFYGLHIAPSIPKAWDGFEIEDIITLATLLCGITDMEYRKKYHSQLFLIRQDRCHLSFCIR